MSVSTIKAYRCFDFKLLILFINNEKLTNQKDETFAELIDIAIFSRRIR